MLYPTEYGAVFNAVPFIRSVAELLTPGHFLTIFGWWGIFLKGLHSPPEIVLGL